MKLIIAALAALLSLPAFAAECPTGFGPDWVLKTSTRLGSEATIRVYANEIDGVDSGKWLTAGVFDDKGCLYRFFPERLAWRLPHSELVVITR